MRKNRKKQPIGILIILVSSIITMNLLGVSYASWNDNIDVAVLISTGFIQPYFIGDEIKIVGNPKGKMDVDTSSSSKASDVAIVGEENEGEITASFINSNTLQITGWCYPTFNKNIFVRIGNEGTIPIAYSGMEAEEDDEIVKKIQYKGFNIKEHDGKAKLSDQDMGKSNDGEEIKIHIQAENEKEIEYRNHSFTYYLQFGQRLR